MEKKPCFFLVGFAAGLQLPAELRVKWQTYDLREGSSNTANFAGILTAIYHSEKLNEI